VDDYLVVISCGSQKIWDRNPNAGPTPARDAYTSSVFKTSRRYAEQFADRWVILSAKYGLIDPDFVIAGEYNRSFYDPDAICVDELRQQVSAKDLGAFKTVGVLGSDAYWSRVVRAFKGYGLELRHVNGNVGFPPLFHNLVNELIGSKVRFRE
jgi:hypothetical protein